jgi:hypothetical protein
MLAFLLISRPIPIGVVAAVSVAFLALLGWLEYSARRRRHLDLMNAASSRGWQWLDRDVPYDCPMNGLVNPVGDDIYPRNAFRGTQNGKDLIAFDCAIVVGRNGRRLCVVTVQSAECPFAPNSKLQITSADGWWAASCNGSWGKSPEASVTLAIIDSVR